MVFLVLTACCRCRVIANIALDKEVRLGWSEFRSSMFEIACQQVGIKSRMVDKLAQLTSGRVDEIARLMNWYFR